MNSLHSDGTVPQLLKHGLLNRLSWRGRALPSSTTEPRSRVSRRLLREEVGAECWASGAEELSGCGHCDCMITD